MGVLIYCFFLPGCNWLDPEALFRRLMLKTSKTGPDTFPLNPVLGVHLVQLELAFHLPPGIPWVTAWSWVLGSVLG